MILAPFELELCSNSNKAPCLRWYAAACGFDVSLAKESFLVCRKNKVLTY